MFTTCPFYGVCSLDRQGSTKCDCPVKYSCTKGKVCASDGLTYQDECKMKLESCKKMKELVIINKGECGTLISKKHDLI